MKSLARSFAGGEISPEMFARLDLAKFQTGAAKCLNFEIRPHGPAVNRAGLEHIIVTKDGARALIPFIYNSTQAYVIEFGDFYVRFHTNGGTVLEATQNITGVTQAAIGVLTYAGTDPANGDWMYLSGIGGMTELNGRYVMVTNVNAGANTFEIATTDGSAVATTGYGAYTAGGTMARVYTLTSPFAQADIPSLEYTQSADVMTVTHVGYAVRELRRLGAASWQFATVAVAPTQVAPTVIVVTPNAAGAVTYEYTVTAIGADGQEESLKATPVANAACQDLTVAGAFNTVTWTNATSGAIRYNVYRKLNGLYGYVGSSSDGTIGFKDINYAPDISQTPPETDDPISSAGNYPGACGYFQSRRWFAGSTNKPLNVWATRSGTEANLTYSVPTQDSDAITARLRAVRADVILHLVPLGDLLALTSGAEWLINAGGNAGPITPGNIDYRPQGYSGSSSVHPVVTNSSVLYAQDRSGHVREITYSWQSQGYKSDDVCLMAPHLFDGYTIVSMAYQRAPQPILWCVRSDGILLGLTYIPEQQVLAWHRHDTDGLFKSVTVIPEGSEDVLYALVTRTVNSATRYCIERKRSRRFATWNDAFLVDGGSAYSGSAATTISGLWHLIGQSVSIFADGVTLPQQTVSAAATVTLPHAATKVAVGRRITADFQTLPLAIETQAMSQATKKNVNKVYVRVQDSNSFWVGPTFSKLTQAKFNVTLPYGTPPPSVSAFIPVVITPNWDYEGQVCIRHPDPTPLTILGLVPDTSLGG